MKDNGISSIKIAAAFIGTISGAGFASGQEILQFFVVFHPWGIVGIIMTTILFSIFAYIVMELGQKLHSDSYRRISNPFNFKAGRIGVDLIVNFFLFGALSVMLAGAGALFQQQFGIPVFYGSLIPSAAVIITVIKGPDGVVNASAVIVPMLIFLVLGVSIFDLLTMKSSYNSSIVMTGSNALANNWVLSAFLYVSYNILISIAVLGPIGNRTKELKVIRRGALLGGAGIGITLGAIYMVIERNYSFLSGIQLPMVYLAGRISPFVQMTYIIVLLSGIYVTAVGSLYGLSIRTQFAKESKGRMIFIPMATVLALAASMAGFSNLVKYLYPIEGYWGIFIIASLVYSRYSFIRRRWKAC